MSGWKATLFGKFNLELEEKKIQGIEGRKVQELLSYLLLFRNRPHSREILSETLWGNQPSLQTRKCLRQTLWRIQSALRMGMSSKGLEFLIHDTWIQFNLSTGFCLDVEEFETIFSLLNGKDIRELDTCDYKLMENAIDIYKGDLLEGWYQDWCNFERERFQIMHLMLLDKLIQFCEIHELYETGLSYGAMILRHDHAYEKAHCQLMRLYYLMGNRTQALRQYEYCVNALRDELGVEPSKLTQVLHEQIRLDTFKPLPFIQKKIVSKVKAKAGPTLQDVLNRLAEVSDKLNKIERQNEEEIVESDDVINI